MTISDYVSFLRENLQEQDLLFKELLIGVTHFFRDTAVWEHLKTETIPALLAEYPQGKAMRAWVSACSTGEEAYSLAIVFKEVLAQCQLEHRFKLQIFATDLDAEAIEKARQGFYPTNIAADVSPERLSRYFEAQANGYRIDKEIREMVIFAKHNIIMDPPFTKIDILCCRNLLIYLSPEIQKKLIPLFHYVLTAHGLLLLGNAETISNFTDLFNAINGNLRLYRRTEKKLSIADIDFPTQYFPETTMTPLDTAITKPDLNLQSQVEHLLLNHYSPAAVVVNAEGDIVYIHGSNSQFKTLSLNW